MERKRAKSLEIEYIGMDSPVEHIHGNWQGKLPEVYRWPYDYSKPGYDEDFVPQNVPLKEGEVAILIFTKYDYIKKPFFLERLFLYICFMNEHLDPSDENFTPEEVEVEKKLRPLSFEDFSGQDQVLENLKIFVQAANLRGEALDHTLFHGPPGLGKTTLAYILANELDVEIKVTSGPVLDKPGDLAGLLTNLEERDVLFIDEIHRLSPIVEEYLYSAMEDYKIDIMIESGPNARSVQLLRKAG